MYGVMYLSFHSVSVGGESLQNVSEHLGFVPCPVHDSGDGVREETLLPKKSINCWFKS